MAKIKPNNVKFTRSVGTTTLVSESSIQVPTDGLQMYLDASVAESYSGTGTTWYDLSGNNRNVEWQSSPTLQSDANGSWFNVYGNSALGDASNSFGLTDGGYTILFWSYQSSAHQNQPFTFRSIYDYNDEGLRCHAPYFSTTNNVFFDINYAGGDSSTRLTTPTTNSISQWVLWSFRSTFSTRSIFQNNTEIAFDDTVNANLIELSAEPMMINGWPGRDWNALMSKFMVYNRALSDQEIIDIYNAGR